MCSKREMKRSVIGVLLLAAAVPCSAQTQTPPAQAAGLRCLDLQDATKSLLASRVRSRYQSEAGASVQLTDDSLVAGSCYHRLIFEISSGQRSYSLPLYLSPDQRFLTRDLTDIRMSPPNGVPAAGNSAAAACAPPSAGGSAGTANTAAGGPVPVSPALLTDGAVATSGVASAPATLVVFSDFQCPYCKRAAEWVRAEAAKFDPKQLRVVYRYFPLSFHPWAMPAAQAAACVAAQSPSGFWNFHDAVFANQAAINPGNVKDKLLELAQSVPGLKVAEYQRCVDSGQTAELVQKDQRLGTTVQVHGTPTVFINGAPLPGLRSPEQLHAAIEDAVKAGTAGKAVETARAR